MKLEMQGVIVIDGEAVDTGDGEQVSRRIEQLPLPTTGTLDCVLKDCCPEQLLSRWKVSGKDEHRRFRGEGVGEWTDEDLKRRVRVVDDCFHMVEC